ncbi:hypothetical protein EVAR_14376_1 [Eumeta japonica]|uniref:115 kDa protein in type-1 retrotransposable element R1DM n=1 Tax=Eumeta variegata TaxID=151549 RepID=A0A4C1TYD2_EUMVA|nr:hypothetical protein EVAR_14376_1 [Eumeta japonica]
MFTPTDRETQWVPGARCGDREGWGDTFETVCVIGPERQAPTRAGPAWRQRQSLTLNGENVAAAVIKAGNCRIRVVSVYFEGDMPIGPYLDRVRYVCSKLGTDKIILGDDVNAWSVWWGSERNDARGGGCLLKSVVDVTACSSALLDRAERWQVVRDVTSSDHNAVTFAVRVEGRSGPRPLSGTRVYNTAKARWSEFAAAMDAALNERTLTTEMVKSVGSCDQLDEVVETYTECIRQACDAAIPRKSSNTRGLKPPGGVPSQRAETRCAHKEAAHPKCGPGSGSTWSGSMCRLGRVIRKQEKPGGCPIKTDSGQVIGPDESATLLAETFSLMTVSILTIRIIRKSEGEPTGVVNHPKLRGSARVDPPFTGAEIRSAPVLGKTVERMLVGRLQWHLMPKLQATQHGFTPQRGTEDALMI